MRFAVIGSTGYIGTRLVGRLVASGHDVTALVRSPDKLAVTSWAERVDVVHGDLEDPVALADLVTGADVVVHLAHALDRPDFPERDRRAAEDVASAAEVAGASRIVYLGGLRPPGGEEASRHLSSRAEVADVFLASAVPTVALEASIVVGSGSASFEMIRYLAERVPVVPAIPWLAHRTQPAAVDDVLHYLVAAASAPASVHRRFDLGGPDVLSYLDLIQRYARLAGLPQRLPVPLPIPVPPGGPALASWVVDLLSPLSHRLVAPLIESLAHELVCDPVSVAALDAALGEPPGGRTTFDAAVRAALGLRPDALDPEEFLPGTIVGDGERHPALAAPTDPAGSGGSVYRWSTSAAATAPAPALWSVLQRLGGDTGWFTPPGVWTARGWADQLLGGVGAYRGRPHGRALRVGDVLDGWRVEALAPGRSMRLRSEERMPGRMWLTFDAVPQGPGARLDLEVCFASSGLAGVAYGTVVRAGAPLVFGPMARGIAAAAG